MAEPWHEFRLNSNIPVDSDNNHKTLTNLYHVTHVENALQIVRDSKIKAGLVYDKSKLNTERILVAWLSPNDWTNAGGFRYGNIRFEFDIDLVYDFKSSYWVENIKYSPDACRFLLATNENYPKSILEYLPWEQIGPWEYDPPDGPHRWNANICLEFMVEKDLFLNQIRGIDFVKHHPQRCNIDPNVCLDKGMEAIDAGSKFISAIISQDLKPNWPLEAVKNGSALKHSWLTAWDKILIKILDSNCNGYLTKSDSSSYAFGRAFFGAYYLNRSDEMQSLCSVFASGNEMKSVLRQMFYDSFRTHVPED